MAAGADRSKSRLVVNEASRRAGKKAGGGRHGQAGGRVTVYDEGSGRCMHCMARAATKIHVCTAALQRRTCIEWKNELPEPQRPRRVPGVLYRMTVEP